MLQVHKETYTEERHKHLSSQIRLLKASYQEPVGLYVYSPPPSVYVLRQLTFSLKICILLLFPCACISLPSLFQDLAGIAGLKTTELHVLLLCMRVCARVCACVRVCMCACVRVHVRVVVDITH